MSCYWDDNVFALEPLQKIYDIWTWLIFTNVCLAFEGDYAYQTKQMVVLEIKIVQVF